MSRVVAISLASALRTERVSRTRVVAASLGLASIVMILVPELELPAHGDAVWMLVALIVPVSYGIESVYIYARWPQGLSALQAVTGEIVVAALMVLPLFLWSGERLPQAVDWSGAEIAILVFAAARIIESLLYFVLIRTTGGVFVKFGSFVSLFAGIAWVAVLFAEIHATNTWLAVASLAIALLLASR